MVTVTSAWRRNDDGLTHMARVQHSSEFGADDRRFDGQTGWTSDRDGTRSLGPNENLVLQEDALSMVELLALKELGARAELDGSTSFNGKAAWRVQLTFRSGVRQTLFLDQTTALELGRTKVSTAPDGSTQEITTTLGDYKSVGGLLLPHTANSSTVSFIINAPIADETFRRPRLTAR